MAPESDATLREEDLEKNVTIKQFKILMESYSDLENRFNTLCRHLGLNVVRNYQKFVIQDDRRFDGIVNQALNEIRNTIVPTKKWYQFWK